jgi:hypothetical protein
LGEALQLPGNISRRAVGVPLAEVTPENHSSSGDAPRYAGMRTFGMIMDGPSII